MHATNAMKLHSCQINPNVHEKHTFLPSFEHSNWSEQINTIFPLIRTHVCIFRPPAKKYVQLCIRAYWLVIRSSAQIIF